MHKKRRDEIRQEASIAGSADKLQTQFANTVARLNKINPNILDGYDRTDVKVRSVTVVDDTDKTAVQRLSAYEENIDQHKLTSFINQHEEMVDKVHDQRSFGLSPGDGIVLKAPELNQDYGKYEQAYENYLQINLQNHLKRLASQQNFEKIDAIIQRIDRRVADGQKLASKENIADMEALDEASALVADRNEEAVKKFVDDEFFANLRVDPLKSARRVKMRR